MINILGISFSLPAGFEFLTDPIVAFAINMVAWILVALLINFVLLRIFKLIARRIPGELEDIIFGILRRPILILFGLYGVDFSLRQLPLLPATLDWIDIITVTIVVLVLTVIFGRFIKDILVYYGEKWALRTETRVDDILFPVLNLFGPLLLVIIAGLIILPLWGVNISSVLLGAGVLGLVLGLALQEPLGNLFSGLSLLIEAPFRKGDLVLLADGRICEVMHLGIRSTILFSLEEQATIYVPNKLLASSMLINLTKPTSEQRYSIDISVDQGVGLAQVQNLLFRIANGHPAILTSDMASKLGHIKEQAEFIRQQAARLPEGDPIAQDMFCEADKNSQTIAKLELEGQFNNQILAFKESLRNLIRALDVREMDGLTAQEHQELYCDYISPTEKDVEATITLANTWSQMKDPWLNDTDYWAGRILWEKRNEQLSLHWQRLKKSINQPDESREVRLDDNIKLMLEWLEKEYKVPPGYWKNPTVAITSLEKDQTHLRLSYYVDNIRLEHDSRPQRVSTELNRLIHEHMTDLGLWGEQSLQNDLSLDID